jgi:RNA polymerase sigma-70 factor (ECF subfamily)
MERAGALWMSWREPEGETRVEAEFLLLIERAVAGDHSAFEQIVARYERRVLTVAWRLLGKLEDAQDASQEVFLKAFRFLHRFDRSRAFEPWLIRMTINVCHDVGRKRGRDRTDVLDQELLRSNSDPHAEFTAEQDRRMLHAVLAELPEKERNAVVLRDLEGFSTTEAAEILGSSEATVRSQICKARMKIRKSVERMKRGRK